jgi:hypothetical protein
MANLNAASLPSSIEKASLFIRESVGLDHGRQILGVTGPGGLSGDFSYRDERTGAVFAAQRSRENPAVAFLEIEVRAGDEFRLPAQSGVVAVARPVTISREGTTAIVGNGKWSAEIFLGEWQAQEAAPSYDAPTPISRLRVGDGPWRGKAFFDTRQAVRSISSTVLESGPLRIVTQFEAKIGRDHSYSARLTFEAGADFIAIDEDFRCDAGDQIVWDFSGADLPEEILLLDSTAGFTPQPLHYFFDRRFARLACWNQFSQLHDFSDGYALTFPNGDDVVGCVVLHGGDWDGNALNFLEAWARRWFPGNRSSRRLVPPEAKADASPSPEKIAARPMNANEAHFSIEGWLHQGRRRYALVLAKKDALRSAEWNASPPLGAFELVPDRARYRQQQSLLRRIHTQHGLFPLAEQLALACAWPVEKPPARIVDSPPPWENADDVETGQVQSLTISARIEGMLQFLAARVYGFWEGSASAHTNPVVSRPLAHQLAEWEWLSAHGHLTEEQSLQCRAWFAFLAKLFSADHYYPGPASMNMGEPNRSLEPTIAGMANQNFFTDVFNLPGMAAQIFPAHPDAPQWRRRFTEMWRRQLEYHVYPESGIWEESHTYFHHVLQTVLPTMERRRDDGVEDDFAYAAFQRLVASALKLLTPRDACFDGKRHVVTLGDHSVEPKDLYRPVYRRLAHRLAASNPDLAAQLAWAYLEMGGTQALDVQPRPMPWRNEYVEGLGYFFRNREERDESLLVLRAGNSWAHHHNDDGSLHFFCAGRTWITDSAFSYPQENGIRKFRADGHSRWAPRDLFPLNHFWQFNRGWIASHQDDGPFAYAVAFTPIYMAETSYQPYFNPLRSPILHWRGVVQLAPGAFLILDRSNLPLSQVTRFHVPADAPLALNGEVSSQNPHLRLHPLLGLHAAQMAAMDRPTQAAEKFATREISFAHDSSPLSAILISVESTPPTLVVEKKENLLLLRHSLFSVEMDFSTPERIVLRDPQADHRQTIVLA